MIIAFIQNKFYVILLNFQRRRNRKHRRNKNINNLVNLMHLMYNVYQKKVDIHIHLFDLFICICKWILLIQCS